MSDLYHQFGGDLALTASGDLALVDGPDAAQQRVLRRLLTNPRDYVWQQSYGAGLARYIGQPASQQRITATILRQMLQEAGVSQDPAPTVSVDVQPTGVVTATINYTDAVTGQPQTVPVPIFGG